MLFLDHQGKYSRDGTEFKNKLWTEVFEKLKTEQKFTPIYSPQCNGRIKGFHKFLKATIAKQLETRVEWDDLVWKATAAYNFFPTESSGVAPFFLMFGHEAAVKHSLLESENPRYLGTDDGMINIGLMTKLYHVIVYNLNEARKARDKNKRDRTLKEPEKLKIGDNILVRDHTSKAFQPKYKDLCIVGLLGKNQVETKDNHGHTTKVHGRDIKKIPMMEKVFQLYEEEQVRKTQEGRKTVPTSKMPDLGWDIAEAQLQETQEKPENDDTHTAPCFQLLITVAIIITAILEQIAVYVKEITKKTAQALKIMTKKANHNKLMQNMKDSYKTARLAVNIVTSMRNHTDHTEQHETFNRNDSTYPGTGKLNDKYGKLYPPHIQDPPLQWQLARPVARQLLPIVRKDRTRKRKYLNTKL